MVDDADAIREGVSRLLRFDGHAVRTAADGAAALAAIAAAAPDLVVLDLSMPGIGGLGVLAALGAGPGVPWVPVVVYTAADDAATGRLAARLGAVALVPKDARGWGALAVQVRALVDRFVRPPVTGPAAPRDDRRRLLAR